MSNPLVRTAVRTLFFCTSRRRALRQAADHGRAYLRLAAQLTPEAGRVPVRVPAMRGVDEDMREWSFFMILEHNVLVNRSITAVVVQLARGEPLHGAARIDPKREVMPTEASDRSRVEVFGRTIEEHLAAVQALGRLRRTATSPHPIFGAFDAHQWNCMFAFHLRLHLRQAEWVVGELERRGRA